MKSIRLAVFVSVAFAISALADGAGNAYVSIDAPGARNQGGVDFAVPGGSDSVTIAVKPQPGWELTSSPVVVIPKGSAGSWSARSFYGESGAGGEICVPTTTVTTNHIRAPKVDIKLQVNHGNGNGVKNAGGEIKDILGLSDNISLSGHGNGNGNGNKNPSLPGNPGNGDKERGGTINIGASVKNTEPGLHRVLTSHDTCPGGKSNVHTESRKDVAVMPNEYKWTWSVGDKSGTANGDTLLVSGISLPRGKYTLSVTVRASNSACGACSTTATASREINIGNGVVK